MFNMTSCDLYFLYHFDHKLWYLNIFQDANMWQDALRVCKEYIPHKLAQLQDEYDNEMVDKSTK